MNQIPHIENAFFNVKTACEQQLHKLYPAGVPTIAHERLNLELGYLNSHSLDLQDLFEIFRLLCDEAKKSMQYISFHNTDASSFLIYLLGGSLANPLPTHYYCPNCGHFELVSTHLCGLDLPQQTCPSCGNTLRSDGFNLSIHTAWGFSGDKIPSLLAITTENFLPFAERILKKLFPHNEVAPMGTMVRAKDEELISVIPSGFLVLPNERTMDDYPRYYSYLEDGTPCLCDDAYDSFLFRIDLKPDKNLEHLAQLQQKSGLYLYDISVQNLSTITWSDIKCTGVLSEDMTDMLYHLTPRTFTEIMSINATILNSYTTSASLSHDAINTNYYKIYQTIKESLFPCFTREDFEEVILRETVEPQIAFRLSDTIRKGMFHFYARNKNLKISFYEEFSQLPIELQELGNCYRYVCSRSMVAHTTLIYALLAYYLKEDPKAYGKVVFQKRK